MKYPSIFLFFVLLSTAFGCKKEIIDQHTSTLDSLITLVDADIKQVKNLDFERTKSISVEVDAYMNFFAGEYENLDNQSFYINELGDLANCQKYTGRILSKYDKWLPKLEENKKQLEDLLHDYKNGIVKGENFDIAFGTEAKIAVETHKDIDKNMKGINYCLEQYQALTASLDSARTDYLNSKK